MDADHDGATWRTSSYSNGSGGNCVEVGADSPAIMVRDTKDRTNVALRFGPDAWRRFAAKVKHEGEA